MILMIDNYDSFVYNLYQYIGIFDSDIRVIRNDKLTLEDIHRMAPERIVLSPGPKAPKDAGICLDVVKEFQDKIPILGICLGHQTIGQALGATVSYAKELYHGKQSLIYHKGNSIFTDIDSPIKVARYHTLSVLKEGLPDCLEVLAETDDGEIMAMRHREYPVVGMQFHPESIYTQHGKRMIENFLRGVI